MNYNSLYFIGVVPPPLVSDEVHAFKQKMANHFGSSYALKNPAHITLQPPFQYSSKSEKRMVRKLRMFAQYVYPFSVQLNGFGHFSRNVIYVNVEDNRALNGLHASLKSFLKNELNFIPESEEERRFHPHMTIANRDLNSYAFEEAWKTFSKANYKRSFQLSGMILFKHVNKEWVAKHKLSFMVPTLHNHEMVTSSFE